MNILFLSKCSPFKEGGAELRTKEVARELSKLGHRVTVLCGKMDEEDAARREWNGIEILCVKVLPDGWLKRFRYPHFFPLAFAHVILMFHLHHLLKRKKFDLIREDLSPFPPSGLLAFKKSRCRRIAVVHNLPNAYRAWAKYYGHFYGFFGYVMERILRRGAFAYDRIITPSRWFSEELNAQPSLTGKVNHIPNGIHPERFAANAAALPPAEPIRLLFVGRFVELKGHRVLIEALNLLKDEFPSLTVTFVGEGPLKESLKDLARRYGLTERIHFMGSVPHEQIPEVYRNCEWVVIPSFFEGSSIAALEAVASQKPLIASDIPGLREVVGDASAVFFEKGNALDLAEKLRWGCRHPSEMKRKIEEAYQGLQRFTWKGIALQELAS